MDCSIQSKNECCALWGFFHNGKISVYIRITIYVAFWFCVFMKTKHSILCLSKWNGKIYAHINTSTKERKERERENMTTKFLCEWIVCWQHIKIRSMCRKIYGLYIYKYFKDKSNCIYFRTCLPPFDCILYTILK